MVKQFGPQWGFHLVSPCGKQRPRGFTMVKLLPSLSSSFHAKSTVLLILRSNKCTWHPGETPAETGKSNAYILTTSVSSCSPWRNMHGRRAPCAARAARAVASATDSEHPRVAATAGPVGFGSHSSCWRQAVHVARRLMSIEWLQYSSVARRAEASSGAVASTKGTDGKREAYSRRLTHARRENGKAEAGGRVRTICSRQRQRRTRSGKLLESRQQHLCSFLVHRY